jgi:hypothetical protein
MIELKAVPHETNLAHVTITRLGDDRSTRYRVSPGEAEPETAAEQYDAKAAILGSDFLRRQYGHIYEEQE